MHRDFLSPQSNDKRVWVAQIIPAAPGTVRLWAVEDDKGQGRADPEPIHFWVLLEYPSANGGIGQDILGVGDIACDIGERSTTRPSSPYIIGYSTLDALARDPDSFAEGARIRVESMRIPRGGDR